MPGDYSKPHLDLNLRKTVNNFKAPPRNFGGGEAPFIREQHGARLQQELRAALAVMDESAPQIADLPVPDARVIEVELSARGRVEDLERRRNGIAPGATTADEHKNIKVALHVPNDARDVLEQILDEYTNGPLLDSGEPPKKTFPEAIQNIREARLSTFWTDNSEKLPQQPTERIWWEVWCHEGTSDSVMEAARKLGAVVAEPHYWLTFPEITVIQLFTDRLAIELLLFACLGVSELRRATATPVFFTEEVRGEQQEWVDDLAERVIWPGNEAPAVCLMDTGVNRAHALIEPALSHKDLLSVDKAWGTDDHQGHGTKMAGLALHGDLLPQLVDDAEYALAHRLESVKLLPPTGFTPNDPASYGPITQSAVALAELENPERSRVFCMAVTNEDVSGDRSTSWSAALDQICAGAMVGDEEHAPRRLFFVSAGNIDSQIEMDKVLSPNDCPVEDPAQAWNAICVGGYTDKHEIAEPELNGWKPMVEPGQVSPYSRTSITWHNGKPPFKPDVVFEAGNRAVNPQETEAVNAESLEVLTTGHEVDRLPLTAFAATSAATAQAARFGARLLAEMPEYWPETLRALIIHSAQWTPAMLAEMDACNGKVERSGCLRRFGFGVPSIERAVASAQNDLALIAQSEIQPFRYDHGKKFGECHYYALPWPRELLEQLGDVDVTLRVVLSYFIEPNPGVSSSYDPQRYQSYGLRFHLKRSQEDEEDFLKRVNAAEHHTGDTRGPNVQDDNRWLFGPKSISAGSVHCDEWTGPAVALASRNILCINPVSGWWRNRASADVCNRKGRYGLVLTLSCADTRVNLYASIEQMVRMPVQVQVNT